MDVEDGEAAVVVVKVVGIETLDVEDGAEDEIEEVELGAEDEIEEIELGAEDEIMLDVEVGADDDIVVDVELVGSTTTGRAVNILSRLPAPQYSDVLPLHGKLHCEAVALVAAGLRVLPHQHSLKVKC